MERNVIELSIENRKIVAPESYLPPTAGNLGLEYVRIALDAEFSGFANYRVTFMLHDPVAIPWDGTSDIRIPAESIICPGSLRITVAALDDNGTQRLITEYMRFGITVVSRGIELGVEPTPDERDIMLRALLAAREVERIVPEFEASQEERAQQFADSERERDAAFSQSQQQRENAFASDVDEWAQQVATEAGKATQAAAAATNAADSLAQRVASGEFNGAPFSIKFTPSSIAAMNRLTSMKKGDFACIQSNPNDEDNSKLFLYDGSQWNFMTDLSGSIGLTGPTGKKGDSVSQPAITAGNLTIKQTVNDQTTTVTLGKVVPQRGVDYWTQADIDTMDAHIDDKVAESVGKEYEVMDKSDYDALAEYELGKLYMVRW